MLPSPLQLDKYFFTKINLEAQFSHCEEMGDIATKVSCAYKTDDERRWMVTLNVAIKQKETQKTPPTYLGEFEIIGFFHVDEDYDKEKLQKLVHFNAPAMLYGAVREMVLNLSSRGPNLHMTLPTVSFLDNKPIETEAPKAKVVAKSPSKPRKTKKKS